ncbi:MAG TPA: Rid family hydrolase [Acidobacteriota bacterium]|nr:Rid family hydrolase [Acidobacteriota bacterium]
MCHLRFFVLTLVLTLSTPVLVFAQSAEREVVAPEGADLTRPYSPAVRFGDFVYLSGSVGNEPGGPLKEGFQAQARQVFENLGSGLKAAGLDFSRVVQLEAFLSDARYFQDFNEIYLQYFADAKPVRATVAADLPLTGALLEVSVIAARQDLPLRRLVPEGWMPSSRYSWGIKAADTLFIAGMVPRDVPAGRLIGGDIGAQTRQSLNNVGAVLKAAGMDFGDVTACKVYLVDARHFARMNAAYREFFPFQDPPSRATVRAPLMSTAAGIEILCTAVDDPQRQVVMAEGASRPSSPFSPAIQAGGRLFLSGMVGRGPEGYGDFRAQTRQTLENLLATLQAAGLDYTDVLEANVWLADIRYYDDLNDIYSQMLPEGPPARTTVGMHLMAPQALVEIRMLAGKPNSP